MASGPIEARPGAPRRGIKRFAKAAGGVIAALIALDIAAGALAVSLGAGFLKP